MHAAEIRRAVDAAPRSNLPEIAALLWQAFAAGHVDEAQAEELHAAIEARQTSRRPAERGTSITKVPLPPHVEHAMPQTGATAPPQGHDASPVQVTAARPRSSAGSRPRSEASLARRRRWAASGRLPPAIAARFTLAEQAALAVIAAETVKRGDCRLCLEHVAAAAGVCRSTVKNALREARRHGLVTVEERRASAWRNLPNVVRILSPEWIGWLRLAKGRCATPTPRTRGGGKSAISTPTEVQEQGKPARRKPPRQSRFRPSKERRAV